MVRDVGRQPRVAVKGDQLNPSTSDIPYGCGCLAAALLNCTVCICILLVTVSCCLCGGTATILSV